MISVKCIIYITQKLRKRNYMKEPIECTITKGTEYKTYIKASSIEQVLEKIKEYHNIELVEKEVLAGHSSIESELESGWWLGKESS